MTWKNEYTLNVTTQDDLQTAVVESINKLEAKNVKVSGNIEIIGYSYLPTTAYIFAQMSTLTFNDGTQVQVLNGSTPVAADKSGDISDVKTKPDQKLNIVPVG